MTGKEVLPQYKLARIEKNLGSLDVWDVYRADALDHDLLTREEEVSLFRRYSELKKVIAVLEKEASDPAKNSELDLRISEAKDIRDEIADFNYRLVVSVAKRYLGRGVPLLDLIQEGNDGLLRAIDKFDYQRGNRFSTYALWWIRQAVSRGAIEQGRTIRLPVHVEGRVDKVMKARRNLTEEIGRLPTTKEIAQHLGWETDQVERTLAVGQPLASLDYQLNVDGDVDGDGILGNFIEDEKAVDPERESQRADLVREIAQVMQTLTPREVEVISLRFGIEDGQAWTLQKIADRFGLSRERIRQIEKKALHKMRHPAHSRRLRDHL